ncbi:MAG: mitochondrial small ribosomal subunit protein uS9m, partial [Candidatus Aenigmarchaeota archaeon]|nr:mitochondrial small ribosomal subunit protein uS9m [Candidatus Aenigmarchaeota archaeon]
MSKAVVGKKKKTVVSKELKLALEGAKVFVGKRKRAVARIRMDKGDKKIIINGKDLENFPKIAQLKILEPMLIAEDENYIVNANVKGGGIMGQAEAIAQGIANGLVSIKGDEIKKKI